MFLTFMLISLVACLFFHKHIDFALKNKHIGATNKRMPLGKSDYKSYINSEAWKSLAKKIRKRDGFRCRLCNAADTELHVHHSTYERLGCEAGNDLITLCKNCHSKFHNL